MLGRIVFGIAALVSTMVLHGDVVINFEDSRPGRLPKMFTMWKNTPQVRIAVAEKLGWEDSKGLRIAHQAKNSSAIYKHQVTPAEKYQVSVLAKVVGAQKPVCVVYWMGENGKINWKLKAYAGKFVAHEKGWLKSSIDVVVPQEAKFMLVTFRVANQTKDEEFTVFDQLELKKRP